MKLFDLHCDTPYELHKKNEGLTRNELHVSLEKAEVFEKYVQCAAVWSDKDLSDCQCLDDFFSIADDFSKKSPFIITTKEELERSPDKAFILTVEDGRLLSGDTANLYRLYEKGVRVLTLFWKDITSLGGAWNTRAPMTPFGKKTVLECFEAGIIPDLSHANDSAIATVTKMAEEAGRPVIATHSNARSVCGHMRNLCNDSAAAIARTGGIIGISLYPPHLHGERANIGHVIEHIKYYVSATGEDSVCLGCDFDGIPSTPDGIGHLGHLPYLFDAISQSLGSSIAEKVFYYNAYNFFINYLPK